MSERKLFWVKVAEYYGKTLSDSQILMYSEDTNDVSINELESAFKAYRNSSDGKFFPMPAQLKNYCGMTIDTADEALQVYEKILEAVDKCGWPDPDGARRVMGELAWECVLALGGWQRFCESPQDQSGVIRAQIRDIAKAKINRQLKGRSHLKPAEELFGENNEPRRISSSTRPS